MSHCDRIQHLPFVTFLNHLEARFDSVTQVYDCIVTPLDRLVVFFHQARMTSNWRDLLVINDVTFASEMTWQRQRRDMTKRYWFLIIDKRFLKIERNDRSRDLPACVIEFRTFQADVCYSYGKRAELSESSRVFQSRLRSTVAT